MSCLFSGGAKGCDTVFDKLAEAVGHERVHFSFAEHRSECETIDLDRTQLTSYDEIVRRANRTLKRRFPTQSGFVNNLLRRNAAIIEKAVDGIYAVSSFETPLTLKGGTGWGVQMVIDRHRLNPRNFVPLFVYDQERNIWCEYTKIGAFLEMEDDLPPMPVGHYGGIGTREPTEKAVHALRELYRLT